MLISPAQKQSDLLDVRQLKLYKAIQKNNIKVVRNLLKDKALAPSWKREFGEAAIVTNNLKIIDLLLEHYNVTIPDIDRKEFLRFCVPRNRVDILNLLLKYYQFSLNYKKFILCVAGYYCNAELIDRLLDLEEFKGNSAIDEKGMVLQFSAKEGNTKILNILSERNFNFTSEQMGTVLEGAVKRGHLFFIKELFQKFSNISSAVIENALELSVTSGNPLITFFLKTHLNLRKDKNISESKIDKNEEDDDSDALVSALETLDLNKKQALIFKKIMEECDSEDKSKPDPISFSNITQEDQNDASSSSTHNASISHLSVAQGQKREAEYSYSLVSDSKRQKRFHLANEERIKLANEERTKRKSDSISQNKGKRKKIQHY